MEVRVMYKKKGVFRLARKPVVFPDELERDLVVRYWFALGYPVVIVDEKAVYVDAQAFKD